MIGRQLAKNAHKSQIFIYMIIQSKIREMNSCVRNNKFSIICSIKISISKIDLSIKIESH